MWLRGVTESLSLEGVEGCGEGGWEALEAENQQTQRSVHP